MTEQQANELIFLVSNIETALYWLIGSVMFIAGFLPVLLFFVGKGGDQ